MGREREGEAGKRKGRFRKGKERRDRIKSRGEREGGNREWGGNSEWGRESDGSRLDFRHVCREKDRKKIVI